MQFSRAMRSALAAGVALAVCGTAAAQSTTIDFVNSELEPIPLLDGSAVTIDGNGNIQANCVLDGGTCQGVVGGAGAPVVTLNATGGNNQVIEGSGNVALTWSATNAPEVCLARATNGYGGWAGIKPASGSASLPFNETGSYALSLECYNDNGSGLSSTVNVTVEEGEVVDGCDITSSDPLFKPNTHTAHIVPWSDAFFGNVYPNVDMGGLSPVGSFTFRSAGNSRGIAMAGHYISIPFTTTASQNNKLEWYRAQSVGTRQYSAQPAHAVWVTISPCAGDFRLANPGAGNFDTLSATCREFAQDGNMFYGTTGTGAQCGLKPNSTYYINILFADPNGGLQATEHTCAESQYCDAIFGN